MCVFDCAHPQTVDDTNVTETIDTLVFTSDDLTSAKLGMTKEAVRSLTIRVRKKHGYASRGPETRNCLNPCDSEVTFPNAIELNMYRYQSRNQKAAAPSAVSSVFDTSVKTRASYQPRLQLHLWHSKQRQARSYKTAVPARFAAPRTLHCSYRSPLPRPGRD